MSAPIPASVKSVEGVANYVKLKRQYFGLGDALLSAGEPPKKRGRFAVTPDQAVLCKDLKCSDLVSCDVMQCRTMSSGELKADSLAVGSLTASGNMSSDSLDVKTSDVKDSLSVDAKGSSGNPALSVGDASGLFEGTDGELHTTVSFNVGTNSLIGASATIGAINATSGLFGSLTSGAISSDSIDSKYVSADLYEGGSMNLSGQISAPRVHASVLLDAPLLEVRDADPGTNAAMTTANWSNPGTLYPMAGLVNYTVGFEFVPSEDIEIVQVGYLGDPLSGSHGGSAATFRDWSLWTSTGVNLFTSQVVVDPGTNPPSAGYFYSNCTPLTLFGGTTYVASIRLFGQLGLFDLIYYSTQTLGAEVTNVNPRFINAAGIVYPSAPPSTGNVANNNFGVTFKYKKFNKFVVADEKKLLVTVPADFKDEVDVDGKLVVVGDIVGGAGISSVGSLSVGEGIIAKTIGLSEQDSLRAQMQTETKIVSSLVYTLLTPDAFWPTETNQGSQWDVSGGAQLFWRGPPAVFQVNQRVKWKFNILAGTGFQEATLSVDGELLATSSDQPKSVDYIQSGSDIIKIPTDGEFTLGVRQNSGVTVNILEAYWSAVRLF